MKPRDPSVPLRPWSPAYEAHLRALLAAHENGPWPIAFQFGEAIESALAEIDRLRRDEARLELLLDELNGVLCHEDEDTMAGAQRQMNRIDELKAEIDRLRAIISMSGPRPDPLPEVP